MEITPAWALLIAFVFGMMVQHYIYTKIWPYRHKIYAWIFHLRRNEYTGAPCETDLQLDRKGYSIGYSFDKRAALWASYVLSRASTRIDKDRAGGFDPDEDIPAAHRVHPNDFTNTGYDKGHLAPSSAIDFSRESNDETFLMSNVVLQHPRLNRQAWRSLEGKIQDWVSKIGKVYIVTGPLYNDLFGVSNEQLNKRVNDISVPTAFYKVIYSEKEDKCIAFLMPNDAVKSADLWSYALSIESLEHKTGYTFFTSLGRRKQRHKKQFNLSWWEQL